MAVSSPYHVLAVVDVSGGGEGYHFGGPAGTRPLIVSGGQTGPRGPSQGLRKIFLDSMANFGNHESTPSDAHCAARLWCSCRRATGHRKMNQAVVALSPCFSGVKSLRGR